jgi:PAS domain S-box-containing protein
MNYDPAASSAASASSTWAPPGGLPPEFGELARLAAHVAGTPFASVALLAGGSAWSGQRAVADVSATELFSSTVRSPGALEVPDILEDPRFSATLSPTLYVRGYAGWPLRTAEGEVLGALAVYATGPLVLCDDQRTLLAGLAFQATVAAALRARIAELEILGGPTPGEPYDLAAAPAAGFAEALVESAPVALYYAEHAHDTDWCNPEYRRMFGLRQDQRSTEWAQGIHPEDRDRVKEIWNDFLRRPRAMTFEYRAVQDGGATRFFCEKVVPTAGEGAYVGSISDFTDLVNTRADLRKVETLFCNTFDQAPIGIVFADREGRFQKYNEAFCSLLGFSAAELARMSYREITPPANLAETSVRLESLWNGGVPFLDLETCYCRKDGSLIWVRSTIALVRDGERADSCVEYLCDVTQRRALTAELSRQRTLLEAVIADLPVGLVACDVSGNITHCNRAAAAVTRWAPAGSSLAETRAVDVFLMDGITPIPEHERPLARALRGETITNLELTVVPHDATPRTTLWSARQLVGPEGEILGAVAVIQDTTERKYQEIELERVNKELITASREAGMAEVATNVLHNVGNILNSVNISASMVAERVRQSKADGVARLAALLAEQGTRVGEFIASDPRGRRIPEYLTALGGQLQADRREALDELGLLRDNLEHIKDTVTMQQSYAKLCGITETVEAVDLVEDSLRLNAGAFARHGVALCREFAEVPPINVDKHKVLQILVNLVRNAKYACDDSGRQDKLITLRIEAAPAGVRISVIDNGIGIAPENLGKLFRHGFTTRASGHGFGLHSGALAAHELGGSLRAESAGTGRGAAFILEIPTNPPARSARA